MPTRPLPNEYRDYFERYISLVDTDDIVGLLQSQLSDTVALLRTLNGDHRYAPGKWSVKQVVGHIIDTERVMAYRALRVSRGDKTALPGFDQDTFVNGADYDSQSMDQLIAEFEVVRQSTVLQFRQLTDAMWEQIGTVSEGPASTRALAYIIAGHEIYHAKLLHDQYKS
jgi:uncharacterized damage-inducible protein DinB